MADKVIFRKKLRTTRMGQNLLVFIKKKTSVYAITIISINKVISNKCEWKSLFYLLSLNPDARNFFKSFCPREILLPAQIFQQYFAQSVSSIHIRQHDLV